VLDGGGAAAAAAVATLLGCACIKVLGPGGGAGRVLEEGRALLPAAAAPGLLAAYSSESSLSARSARVRARFFC
jgi:hypothetical protein